MAHSYYILFCLLLSSCCTIENHGYNIQERTSDLKLDLHKDEVGNILGSPTLISNFANESWYYVGQKLEKKAFLTPKIKSQTILKLSFHNNKLNKISYFDKNDILLISYDKHYTKSAGDDNSLFREFMSNLGKYNVKPQLNK